MFLVRVLLLLFILPTIGIISRPSSLSAQTVWELTPYRIQVLLAVSPDPAISPRLIEDIRRAIEVRAREEMGAAWDLQTEVAPHSLSQYWLGLDAPQWQEKKPPQSIAEFDKCFALVLKHGPVGYEIQCREWDERTRIWGTPITRSASHSWQLPISSYQVIRKSFAPLAEIQPEENDLATLRIKGSRLSTRISEFEWTQPGDIFRPIIRYNDREGIARQVTPIDWTFLVVQQVEAGKITAQINTGLRSPLSGRRRGRVEFLALLVHPPKSPTRLLLESRTEPGVFLSGYEVFSHPPGIKDTELLGRSDLDGSVLVPPAPEGIRILLIRHGSEVLARLPILPGLSPQASAPTPDDTERLEAEGFVNGLQETFVDLVARRQVLIFRIRSAIDNGQFEEARTHLNALRGMGTPQQFLLELRGQRQLLDKATDPRTKAKIDRLFQDTEKIVQKFFDASEIQKLQAQLQEAQKK